MQASRRESLPEQKAKKSREVASSPKPHSAGEYWRWMDRTVDDDGERDCVTLQTASQTVNQTIRRLIWLFEIFRDFWNVDEWTSLSLKIEILFVVVLQLLLFSWLLVAFVRFNSFYTSTNDRPESVWLQGKFSAADHNSVHSQSARGTQTRCFGSFMAMKLDGWNTHHQWSGWSQEECQNDKSKSDFKVSHND